MTYDKQVWVNFVLTPLSAERLNHIEDGLAAVDAAVSDTDLMALAALSTTPYGRAFLELADAAAARTALALGSAAQSASSAFAPAVKSPTNITQFWRADGSCATPAGGWTVVQTSVNVTAAHGQIIEVDATAGDITVTGPITSGTLFFVKKMDNTTNKVIIAGATGATDGGPSVFLDGQYQARLFGGNGVNLDVLGERKPFGSPAALDGPGTDGTAQFQSRSDHKHPVYMAVTPIPTMGSSQTLSLANKAEAMIDGTLSASTCALTFSGFPSSPNHGMLVVRLHQDSSVGGKKFTITNTVVWAEGYPPVMPQGASQVLEFIVWAIDGGTGTIFASHGQPVRYHRLNLSGALTDGYTGKLRERIDNDFRIVKVWTTVGDAPVTTSAVFTVNLGTFGGSVATVYTTSGNRPSVAAGANYGSAVLPDVVDGLAGQYLTGGVITASTSGYAQLVVATVETQ